jgi:hypothetical protein
MERDNGIKQTYVLNILIREIPVTGLNFGRDTGYISSLFNNAPSSLRLCPIKWLCLMKWIGLQKKWSWYFNVYIHC